MDRQEGRQLELLARMGEMKGGQKEKEGEGRPVHTEGNIIMLLCFSLFSWTEVAMWMDSGCDL